MYKLIRYPNGAHRIIRGAKVIGSVTQVNGRWHARLRVEGGNAIMGSGDTPQAAFDKVVDQRLNK